MAFMLQDVIKEPEESRSLEPLKKLKRKTLPNWQSLSAGGLVAIQTWSIYKVYT